IASCDSGPPGALSLYQRHVFGVSSKARSFEKLASMKARRPNSPAAMASPILRIPAISRALWPTVTVLPTLRHLARHWQVLLVGYRKDHALNFRIAENRLHTCRRWNPEFLLKSCSFLFRTAVAGNNLKEL